MNAFKKKKPNINKIILKLQDHELLSKKAYRILKEAIIKGEIKTNTRLTLIDISQQMGISITPIREAINQLSSEGLVKIIPNKGIVINEISMDDYQEILQIRAALEGLIIELALKKITDKNIEDLMEIVRQMETAVEKDNRLDYNELDIKFHDFLLNIAGNHRLKEVYNRIILQDHNNKFRLRTLKLSYRMRGSLQEHKSIAYCVKERNIAESIRKSQEHIYSILKSLEEDERRTQKGFG